MQHSEKTRQRSGGATFMRPARGVLKARLLLCATVLLACGAASADVPQADGQNRKTIAEERQIAPRTPALAGLKRAAENGDTDAQVEYARKLHRQFNDPDEGFRWLERAAAQNHPEGLYILSLYYLNGWSVARNPEMAFNIMQKSADTGFVGAQLDLGLFYIKGDGTQIDLKKAAEWIRKAADVGHPVAQYEMGLLHLNGEGVQRNFGTALQWFWKAGAQHHPDAMFYVGAALYEGAGVEKDQVKGWELIQDALRLGSKVASDNLKGYPKPAGARP
ncbi:sel1 repeat family protein [Massilia violaceinigra]|uniref:Sel1 repeat family protein n=1 Tax=Massilia violaceinigra TaxID=2045208 RepID=A0ABY4AEM0_9BURK|nr:tetratricopeptide repeat protein [Massilia violaceinigra]UOD32379.1 sel1 repeat family protein [Massilia violaceinigra]